MNELLNTIENISTLSLCYLDEVDEYLKEVDETTYFAISPLSVSYKRLYLMGDYIYKGTVTVSAFLPENFDADYQVKLRLGQDYTDLNDFEEYTNVVSGNYESLTFKYGNAIPIDIMIYSNNITETHTEVKFVLEWDDNTNNCNNPSFIRTQQTVQDIQLPENTIITYKLNNVIEKEKTFYEPIFVYDAINYFRVNTIFALSTASIDGEAITYYWNYDECVSIYDNNNLFKLELKGMWSLPK